MLSAIKSACKALGAVAWISPGLLRKRSKAMMIFQKELQAQGLDPETIKELTATYKGLGDWQNWR